jgi:dienelactone hydrolase
MKILISHGSGGITAAEADTRDFLVAEGYDVQMLDYFTQHGINSVRWSPTNNPSNYDVTFEEMFDIEFPSDDIIHIGFSLGGFLGLVHNEKFVHNFLFYPAILGFTQAMLERDYTNTTVFLGSEDAGKSKYEKFQNQAVNPPSNVHLLQGAHHAFMVDGIDRQFDMVQYDGNYGDLMGHDEFCELRPNHEYLSGRYGNATRRASRKFNRELRDRCWYLIKKQIDEVV